MKYKYIILLLVFMSCKNKINDDFRVSNVVIYGKDTISMFNGSTDYTKLHSSGFHGNGHNDTINNIFYDTMRLLPIHDTIYTNDTSCWIKCNKGTKNEFWLDTCHPIYVTVPKEWLK